MTTCLWTRKFIVITTILLKVCVLADFLRQKSFMSKMVPILVKAHEALSHISLLPYRHVLPNGTYLIEDFAGDFGRKPTV